MGHFYQRILLFTALIFSSVAHAEVGDSTRGRRWYLPHYVPIQFAGYTGLVSTGLGFAARHQNYSLDLLYGYVPRSVAGVPVHTITAKNYFPVGRFQLNGNEALIPYVGLGVSVEIGGIAFFKQPERFPESYYDFPKNLHALVYGGVRMQHLFNEEFGPLGGMELYTEVGSVDVYIWYRSQARSIRLRDIFSLALGVNLLLSK